MTVRTLTEGASDLGQPSLCATATDSHATRPAFRRADHDNDGWINVGYEQFMDMVRLIDPAPGGNGHVLTSAKCRSCPRLDIRQADVAFVLEGENWLNCSL